MTVMLTASVHALDTLTLLDNGPSRSLLQEKKPICAEIAGSVPVEFSDALVVFGQPDLLQDVQDVYCELIADKGSPEFTIQQTSSNEYFYVNRKNERTDIVEVVPKQTSENVIDIVYYSIGERFFGRYEAIIHVRIIGNGNEETSYAASIYAYPENAFSRFFARRFGLVERYFRNKTSEMSGLIATITCALCNAASDTAESESRDPASNGTSV